MHQRLVVLPVRLPARPRPVPGPRVESRTELSPRAPSIVYQLPSRRSGTAVGCIGLPIAVGVQDRAPPCTDAIPVTLVVDGAAVPVVAGASAVDVCATEDSIAVVVGALVVIIAVAIGPTAFKREIVDA